MQNENVADLIVCCMRDDDQAQALFYTLYLDTIRRAAGRQLSADVERHLSACLRCSNLLSAACGEAESLRELLSTYDEAQVVCAENSENPPAPSGSLVEARERLAASRAERGNTPVVDGIDAPTEARNDQSLKQNAHRG